MPSPYGRKWRTARGQFLAKHPLCIMCERARRDTIATIVDHIIPHGGDLKLFWDRKNWQPLCQPHHDSTKRAQERGGAETAGGVDLDGRPTDPGHLWNRPAPPVKV